MARQPDQCEGISLNLEGLPGGIPKLDEDPQVGDIFLPRAGQPAFWWIVSIIRGEYHHTAIYLIFNRRGECTGTGKVGMSYLAERQRVGHADILPIEPSWCP